MALGVPSNLNYNLVINATMQANVRAATRQVNTSLKQIQDELQRTRSHLKEMGALAGAGLGMMELGRRMKQAGMLIGGAMLGAARAVATMGREFQLYRATFNFFYGDRADSLWKRTKILAATSRFTTRSVTELVATMGKFEGASDVIFEKFTARGGGTQTALETLQDILMMNPSKNASDMVRAMSEIMSEPGKRSMLALRRLFQIPSNVINKIYTQFTEDMPSAEKLRLTLQVLTREYGGLMGAARETFDFYVEQVRDVGELIRQEMFEQNEKLMMGMAKKVYTWLFDIYKNKELMKSLADNFRFLLKIIEKVLDALMVIGDILVELSSNKIIGKLVIGLGTVAAAFLILAGGMLQNLGLLIILGTSVVGMTGALKALTLQELENIAVTDQQTRAIYAQAMGYNALGASRMRAAAAGVGPLGTAGMVGGAGAGAGTGVLTGATIGGVASPIHLGRGPSFYSPYTGFVPLKEGVDLHKVRAMSFRQAMEMTPLEQMGLRRFPEKWQLEAGMSHGKPRVIVKDARGRVVGRSMKAIQQAVRGHKGRFLPYSALRTAIDIDFDQLASFEKAARGQAFPTRAGAQAAFAKDQGWSLFKRITHQPVSTIKGMWESSREFLKSPGKWGQTISKINLPVIFRGFVRFAGAVGIVATAIDFIIRLFKEAKNLGSSLPIFGEGSLKGVKETLSTIFSVVDKIFSIWAMPAATMFKTYWQLIKGFFSGIFAMFGGGGPENFRKALVRIVNLFSDLMRVMGKTLFLLSKFASLWWRSLFEGGDELQHAGNVANKMFTDIESFVESFSSALDILHKEMDRIARLSGDDFLKEYTRFAEEFSVIFSDFLVRAFTNAIKIILVNLPKIMLEVQSAYHRHKADVWSERRDRWPGPQFLGEWYHRAFSWGAGFIGEQHPAYIPDEMNEAGARVRSLLTRIEGRSAEDEAEDGSSTPSREEGPYTPPSYASPSFQTTINVYASDDLREKALEAMKEADEQHKKSFRDYTKQSNRFLTFRY
jgi:hypothetical protein